MTQEDYCSYELSKLLKEKGFDEVCTRIYIEIEGRWGNYPYQPTTNSQIKEVIGIMCPTHQMAMKWLREVYKISIEIYCIPSYTKGLVVWRYMIRNCETCDEVDYPEWNDLCTLEDIEQFRKAMKGD